MSSYAIRLLSGDGSLLGNVNSIKELTQILITDVGRLLNLSSSKRNKSNVISTEENLILLFRPSVLHSLQKRNLTNPLLSKEVTNLHIISVKGNIDGEMRVHETHVVDESLSHSDDHVVNVGADGTDASELFTGGEPQVDADGFVADFAEVHVDVLEVTGEGATGSGDLDDAGGDFDGDWREREKRR